MRIQIGYQDIRDNNEDFVLTPFLLLVIANEKIIKVYGIGICWLFYSFYIGIGFNIDRSVPYFVNHSKKTKTNN